MSLHRISRITVGVPDVEQAAGFYTEFGLGRLPDQSGASVGFATADGGEQLRLLPSPRRRLIELRVAADDRDDLDRIVDDALWTPQEWEGTRGLYSWGPPPPPSFLAPDDLAELMAGNH